MAGRTDLPAIVDIAFVTPGVVKMVMGNANIVI